MVETCDLFTLWISSFFAIDMDGIQAPQERFLPAAQMIRLTRPSTHSHLTAGTMSGGGDPVLPSLGSSNRSALPMAAASAALSRTTHLATSDTVAAAIRSKSVDHAADKPCKSHLTRNGDRGGVFGALLRRRRYFMRRRACSLSLQASARLLLYQRPNMSSSSPPSASVSASPTTSSPTSPPATRTFVRTLAPLGGLDTDIVSTAALAVSPDGSLMASSHRRHDADPDSHSRVEGSASYEIRLWQVGHNGRDGNRSVLLEKALPDLRHTAWQLTFSPCGHYLAVDGRPLLVFETKTGRCVLNHAQFYAAVRAAIAASGGHQNVGGATGRVMIGSALTGDDVPISGLSFHPSGEFLAVCVHLTLFLFRWPGIQDGNGRRSTGMNMATPAAYNDRAANAVCVSLEHLAPEPVIPKTSDRHLFKYLYLADGQHVIQLRSTNVRYGVHGYSILNVYRLPPGCATPLLEGARSIYTATLLATLIEPVTLCPSGRRFAFQCRDDRQRDLGRGSSLLSVVHLADMGSGGHRAIVTRIASLSSRAIYALAFTPGGSHLLAALRPVVNPLYDSSSNDDCARVVAYRLGVGDYPHPHVLCRLPLPRDVHPNALAVVSDGARLVVGSTRCLAFYDARCGGAQSGE